jgi:hypothetical protein
MIMHIIYNKPEKKWYYRNSMTFLRSPKEIFVTFFEFTKKSSNLLEHFHDSIEDFAFAENKSMKNLTQAFNNPLI